MVDGLAQRSLDAVPVHSDVEIDRSGPGEQSIEVTIEVSEHTMVESDPLPDAVAHQEARVKHGDLCLVPREELPVDVDLDGLVALVSERLMGTAGHGQHARRSSPRPPPR